ncbi:tumor necrosis factor receptor superfamily member 10A-like isoform X1 [Pantherophis guttatus]|uniref:Tumor necrosis factor receptor superfamily member 10A-like isoform X1 n=2 Tax=Pantherophis guttatus TaxID=94885 RepID=A0ABM3YXM4_PANGU|nr:tumor necrosis factor receptor superfamily member 10A-like isoform X1 [Pantherophis guttatus]
MRAQFLLTLGIVLYLRHEAIMARLPQTQDPMIPDDDTDQYYTVYGDHECRKCPPGTFVLDACRVPRTEGTCQPCENNTYSKHSNSFVSCFSCRACRILDEVEIKKCTATTNTRCACKNGTFCSPGQPCETCTKCMTSCGPGEKKVQDCTPTSDIQCVPDTTSSPPTKSPGQGDHLVWLFVLVPVLFAVVLGLVIFCCWRKNTNFREVCIGFWTNKRTQFLQYLPKKSSPEVSEEHDNMLNTQRMEKSKIPSPSPSTANGQAPEIMNPLRASAPEEEGREHAVMRKLVPRNCNDKTKTLSQSFDVFIDKVPQEYWKRFMRLLKLSDNEIDSATISSQYKNDQYYQMLRTWLDKNGQAATLNVLLEGLRDMDLKGIAEEITNILLNKHLYVYED